MAEESQQQSQEELMQQALIRKMRLKGLMDESKMIDQNIEEKCLEETLPLITRLTDESNKIMVEGGISDRSEHTTEVLMDVQLLKMTHMMMSKIIKQNDFQPQIYINNINNLVHDGNWHKLAEKICVFTRTVRVQPSMLGTFEMDVQPKVAKQRKQRQQTQVEEEKRPDMIEKLTRRDYYSVNVILTQLAAIFKKNKRQPVPFYKLIIDPNNFMNTVENSLQLSFLAQRNRIAIDNGADNLPVVRLITSDKEEKDEEEEEEVEVMKQAICPLNMEICDRMIKLYNITESMLKNPES